MIRITEWHHPCLWRTSMKPKRLIDDAFQYICQALAVTQNLTSDLATCHLLSGPSQEVTPLPVSQFHHVQSWNHDYKTWETSIIWFDLTRTKNDPSIIAYSGNTVTISSHHIWLDPENATTDVRYDNKDSYWKQRVDEFTDKRNFKKESMSVRGSSELSPIGMV